MLELLNRSSARCVKDIAVELGIAEDVASKNLQRLAAAGFLIQKNAGKYLFYTLVQEDVLLAGVLELANVSKKDHAMFMATALTHERRIVIINALGGEPLKLEELCLKTQISWGAMRRQLEKLLRRGFVGFESGKYALTPPGCTLGKRLVELALRNSTPAQV